MMGRINTIKSRNGKPLRSFFGEVCDPLPITVGFGIGFGSPLGHPRVTQASPKGHAGAMRASNGRSALFAIRDEKKQGGAMESGDRRHGRRSGNSKFHNGLTRRIRSRNTSEESTLSHRAQDPNKSHSIAYRNQQSYLPQGRQEGY